MSGDAHNSNMETWAIIKFLLLLLLLLQGKAPKEIHTILTEIFIKHWVAQFKCGDFSTCDSPRPGQPKTVTTPEIIDQIHELILEDHLISAKSIAEQLGISREQLGSIIHENLDMLKLSAKCVPKCLNAGQKRQRCQPSEQLLEFFRRDPNDFCRDWWPWTKLGYITMTRRQSNKEWSGSIAAYSAQKIPSAKKSLEKFSPRYFGIKAAYSSLIIFQRGKLSTQSITYLCWCKWRTLRRKNAAGSSPRGCCSCTTMPRLTGHLQPGRNWPTWTSSVFTTHPRLLIWPHRTTTFSLDWKNN